MRAGGSFDALVGVVPAQTVLDALGKLVWLRPGYFEPDMAYIREISLTAIDDWVVIAPQVRENNRNLDGLGMRTVVMRQPRRGELFGALSDPKHRPPAARVVGARPSWGDTYIDSLVCDRRAAMLVYPVVENASAAMPSEVIVAFTLFAPPTAQPLNGQVVQFKAKNSGYTQGADRRECRIGGSAESRRALNSGPCRPVFDLVQRPLEAVKEAGVIVCMR